tara:strand:+ start:62 stop:721 length:660 start_codon:yes stop_codon:yes gene_type:complete
MAVSKQYAYYLEGNQLAIVEKDVNFDNNVDNKEYGPGVARQQWKSPLTTVADALEIKYVYSPTYRVNDASDTKTGTAYTENGEGLLSLTTNPSMSATAGDWVLITGSDKWNGLHQVNTTVSSGTTLVLKTKYNGEAVTGLSFTLSLDISILQDESFELDLPNYLQKALVYYVKAKMFEDTMNIKGREYAMREFKKMLEKYENSRISGLRIASSGSHAIR